MLTWLVEICCFEPFSKYPVFGWRHCLLTDQVDTILCFRTGFFVEDTFKSGNKFTHWLNWGGEVKYWPVALRSDLVRTRSSRTGGRLQRGRDLKMGRFHLKNPLRSILRFSKQGTVWRTFSSISSHGSRSICWSRLVPVKLCQCFIWECHWTTERQSCAVVPRNLCKVFTGQNSSGMRSKLKCCGSAVLKVPKCWGLSSSWSSSE